MQQQYKFFYLVKIKFLQDELLKIVLISETNKSKLKNVEKCSNAIGWIISFSFWHEAHWTIGRRLKLLKIRNGTRWQIPLANWSDPDKVPHSAS